MKNLINYTICIFVLMFSISTAHAGEVTGTIKWEGAVPKFSTATTSTTSKWSTGDFNAGG